MNKNKPDCLQKAKNYAFLLLKFRQRSERELALRLRTKKFDEPVIKETLYFLKTRGFIDDAAFAKEWAESRLKRPLGRARIKQELQIKGIDKNIIDATLEKISQGYSEKTVVEELAKTRFAKLIGIEPQKAKRRIFAYLLRRGFSSDSVSDAIDQL